MTKVYLYSIIFCIPSDSGGSMFNLVHCLGDGGVVETLANTCVVNTKLKRVESMFISSLPVMKSLGTRQVPLEELVIHSLMVC